MNFCTTCGNQLKSGAKFCSKCGQIVTTEAKLKQSAIHQEPICSQCRTQLAPGVRFCTSCGAAVKAAPIQEPAFQPIPQRQYTPPVNPLPPKVQDQPAVKPPVKNKGKKILVIAVSTIILLAAAAAALYFFGTFQSKDEMLATDLSALYEDEKYDKNLIDSVANVVEAVFLSADTTKLAEMLSKTTLEQKREFFSQLQPYMAEFGNDFKNRKFLYATPRFAVYEFTSAQGSFTVDFCLGEDGKWKLMRF